MKIRCITRRRIQMQSSMSSVGKSIRMNRIFKEDGRAVMVAINHGLGMGPIQGIEHMGEILDKIIPENPDSLTIHKGNAIRFQDHFAGKTALQPMNTMVPSM